MLSKIIVKSYGVLIEIALWLFLVACIVGGSQVAGLQGFLAGLAVWFVFSVVVLGGFLVLLDIRNTVERIGKKTATQVEMTRPD